MKLKYIACILCIILYVTIPGCTSQEDLGNKGQAIEMIKNDKNAIISAWNSTGHSTTINSTSIQLIAVQQYDKTHISTFHFNTTNGETHTSNVSDANITNPVVIDIDGWRFHA